jgi:hypothetical protein
VRPERDSRPIHPRLHARQARPENGWAPPHDFLGHAHFLRGRKSAGGWIWAGVRGSEWWRPGQPLKSGANWPPPEATVESRPTLSHARRTKTGRPMTFTRLDQEVAVDEK